MAGKASVKALVAYEDSRSAEQKEGHCGWDCRERGQKHIIGSRDDQVMIF